MYDTTKFVYVSLDKINDFQKVKEGNNNIVPCSLYVDKEKHTIYFVEQESINNNIESI